MSIQAIPFSTTFEIRCLSCPELDMKWMARSCRITETNATSTFGYQYTYDCTRRLGETHSYHLGELALS